jgi:diacylglycerol kinase family enzyme
LAESAARIPAIVNLKSGTADQAREAIEAAEAFELFEVEPEDLPDAVREALADGARRLLVAGGDGTIGTAAWEVLDNPVELAILPGGTLNHFARDLGISTEPAEALEIALHGEPRGADVGMVNGRLFLNTSSVGAYVRFVRVRERLEKYFGYRIASAIAAFRLLFQLRLIAVEVEVDGQRKIYRTPLVFIGVGERELKAPLLGKRVPDGRRGLHVMIVRGRSRARIVAIALAAIARGVKSVARTPELDSFLVDRCTITPRHAGQIAVDGELVRLGTPLEYELRRDALTIVCPPETGTPAASEEGARP